MYASERRSASFKLKSNLTTDSLYVGVISQKYDILNKSKGHIGMDSLSMGCSGFWLPFFINVLLIFHLVLFIFACVVSVDGVFCDAKLRICAMKK